MQVGLKQTGTSASVPDSPTARLMYYLDCICSVLKLDDDEDISRLRNYNQYSYLSNPDKNLLIHMCYLLSPDTLLDKCIFQCDSLCGDSTNEFYDLETLRNTLVVAGSVMIGGRQKRVTKIMTFKMSWLRRYWEQPMKELTERQERQRSRAQRDESCLLM